MTFSSETLRKIYKKKDKSAPPLSAPDTDNNLFWLLSAEVIADIYKKAYKKSALKN
jgi:hypothetical protein